MDPNKRSRPPVSEDCIHYGDDDHHDVDDDDGDDDNDNDDGDDDDDDDWKAMTSECVVIWGCIIDETLGRDQAIPVLFLILQSFDDHDDDDDHLIII